MRAAFLGVMACGAFALAGCKGEGQPRPDRLAMERLETVARAHADDRVYLVRLNPAACDCPRFEVRLDGAWYRVFLEPEEAGGPADVTRAALEAAAGRGEVAATALVTGKLVKGTRLAKNRAVCLVLKVESLCPPGGCPAEGG